MFVICGGKAPTFSHFIQGKLVGIRAIMRPGASETTPKNIVK